MTALHDPDAEDEPSAKRQATLPMLSQVESLTSAKVATAKDECPSTPVDPNISQFTDGAHAAAPAQYAAEERMRSLGLVAFCDALAFAGLREELLRYSAAGVTILAPTDDAFAQVPEEVRTDVRLVRSLLLGHLCTGTFTLEVLKDKECAVAIAGQTHAVYEEDSHTCVGTACFGRTDLAFEGGMIQELTSVMMVLWLVRDSHTEQVWKKSLQPSPVVSTVGGNSNTGNEYEVHGCLLHAATGSLIPDGLRGHTRSIKPLEGEQRLAFTEITVLTKPPSLAKRRGVDAEIGNNRYRLLFSVWNTATQSYVTWQHMATPLVVRNSFHMLPLEEKNYRRTQYARSRGRPMPLTAREEATAAGCSGDSGRSEDGEGTQHEQALNMPRLAFEPRPAKGGGEETDTAALLCAMASGFS